MKKFLLLFILFGVIFINEAAAQKSPSFKNQFKWLKGTWEMKTDYGNMVEQWEKVDGHTYKAVANFLSQPSDDLYDQPLEEMTLINRKESIVFISKVRGENEDMPVEFIYMGIIDGWHTFENPTHDFPQRVLYKLVDENTLYSKIDGMENGEFKKIEFNYTKR